jgi:hypothetical protein
MVKERSVGSGGATVNDWPVLSSVVEELILQSPPVNLHKQMAILVIGVTSGIS